MEEVEIPESLREFPRPEFPFPFTGPVEERNRGEIRASLEAEWRPEAARQRMPTVATVAALIQLRTLWRWEQGWRMSRINGNWIFIGNSQMDSFNRRLASKTEDRSALRGG